VPEFRIVLGYEVTLAPRTAIRPNVTPFVLRHTWKPVSLFELSVHARFIWVCDTAVAVRPDGAGVGVRHGVAVGVGVSVGVAVDVGVGVAVGLGAGVAVAVGVTVGVGVAVGVAVAVGVGVKVEVGVGVAVGVAVAVGVGVGVGFGVEKVVADATLE
jgi:hypothetical protein